MVSGYEYGAKYIITLNKEINWFDLMPDIMKETKIYYPHTEDKKENTKTIDITYFLPYNDSLKTENSNINELFRSISELDFKYDNLRCTCFTEDDYNNLYLNKKNEYNDLSLLIEQKINEMNVLPFVLLDKEIQAINIIKEYCQNNDIKIVYNGWKYVRVYY